MTAFPLPTLQSAVKPVSSGSRGASANSGTDEPSSFQDALASKVNKTGAQAQTGQLSKVAGEGKATAQPTQPENAADAASADQTAKAVAESIAAGKAINPDAGGFVLTGEIAGEAASKDAAENEGIASVIAPDQLLTLPATANIGIDLQPRMAVKHGAEARVADDAKQGLPHVDLTAKAVKPDQPDLAQSLEQAADPAGELSTDSEFGTQSDFSRLLAGREAQSIVTAAAKVNAAMNTNVIEPRLGSRGWDQAVSQKVVWMAGALEQSATLTLNPPDLGPLQVVVSVHNDQASTLFVSENPEVRQALQDSINTLRSMLGNAGITLGEANISNGEQAQQQFQQANRQASGNSRSQAPSTPAQLDTISTAVPQGRNGLVDTFA